MIQYSFDTLPKVVAELIKEVSELKQLVIANGNQSVQPYDKFLSVKEVAELMNLTIPTIYSKVSRKELPHLKKGKHLYFSRDEIMNFIKSGRVQTAVERGQEVVSYFSKNKKGLNNEK